MRVVLALSLLLVSTAVAVAEDDCSKAPRHTLPLEPLEFMENTSCLKRGNHWMIAAYGRDDVHHGARIVTVVVDSKGRRLASARTTSLDRTYGLVLERTLDVDGDGALEILALEREEPEGGTINGRLVVLGVRGSDILRLLSVPLTANNCPTPYAVVDDGKRQRLELRCTKQPRTFAWTGIAMREVGVETALEQHDPSCPPLSRIARLMNLKPGETIGTVACGAGAFPRPATVVFADRERSYDDDYRSGARSIFVLEGERVVARHRAYEYLDVTGVYDTHALLATGDLDGDGIDELVVEKTLHSPINFKSMLIVFRVRGGALTKVREQWYRSEDEPGFDPPGEHVWPKFAPEDTLACDAKVELRPRGAKRRGVELVVTRTPRIGAKVPKDRIPAGFCTAAEKL